MQVGDGHAPVPACAVDRPIKHEPSSRTPHAQMLHTCEYLLSRGGAVHHLHPAKLSRLVAGICFWLRCNLQSPMSKLLPPLHFKNKH